METKPLKKQTTYYLVGEHAPSLAEIEAHYNTNIDLNTCPTTEYVNIDNKYCYMPATGAMYKIQPCNTITTPDFIIQTDTLIEVLPSTVIAEHYTMAKLKIAVRIIPELQLRFIIEIEKNTRTITAYYFETICAVE